MSKTLIIAEKPSVASDITKALGGDAADVDTLASRTGLAPDAVVAALTNLELAGRIAALPGGLWQRLHRT